MKTQSLQLRALLALTGISILSQASAVTLYWDGASTTINGLSSSTTATTWSTSVGNWDNGTAEVFWTTANSAVFGGTASTVSIGTGGISIGSGSQFMRFDVTGYTIAAGSNGLNFGTSATDNITLFANGANSNVTTTFTGTVGGSGNVILSSLNGPSANTFLFNGTSAGGWSGTTTVNAGMTLSVAASSQALLNTGGITLNGGNIMLTNTATGSENTIDRINDTAAISSYGSTSISIANTATASRAYTETIGAITHNNGQLSIGFTINQNQASNTQTLNIGGLNDVSGGTATIAVNSGGSGAGSIGANSNIRVAGIANSTPVGEIIGPWMTAGSILGAQSDWAVYTSDVVGGYRRIASAAIGATAQSTWSSTTGNYTAATTAPTASPVNVRLTGDRFVNTLRATFAETTNAGNWTFDLANDKVVFASHNLSDGDVVQFRSAPTGLTDNRPYYVINAAAGEFKLSLTPGGVAVDLTNAAAGFMSTGLNLNGNTLGTNGFIVGTTGSASIGGGSASTLTLATTTSGNLYLHGASNIWIDPSIKNNGAGLLTLVKSGTNTVTLSGDNTYTGGTVINAGTVNFASAGSWVSGQNITFGGSGSITASVGALTGGIMKSEQGAIATMSGSSGFTFASTTGAGTILYNGSSTLNLGNASAFTGDLISSINGSNNSSRNIQFSSIADTVGSRIGFGGGEGDSNQRAVITLGGNAGAVTLDNRQVGFLTRFTGNNSVRRGILQNNNANAANTFVINSDLFNNSDRSVEFILEGSNTGNNAFNGDIGNSSSFNGSALGVYKAGAGKWILGGTNTFTGTVIVNNGILSVASINNSDTAGTLGMNNTIQLGGQDPAGGTAYLPGSNSGTLEYTGVGQSSTRSFRIGDNVTAGNTGGGGIANNGTGAITFSAANFNTAVAGITGTRTLTLGGINTGNNEVQGIIRDNVASTGKINFAKSGTGTWILSGSNAMTGTNNLSGAGTLVLNYTTNDNAKLASGALTLDGGKMIFRQGTAATETVASTSISATTPSGTFLVRESGSSTINLNGITVNGTQSVLSFSHDNMATTDRTNVNGILGAWFTVGSSWAANSTNLADGAITAYTGATAFASATGTSEDINFELQDGATLAGSIKTNTLRIVSTLNDQVLNIGSSNLQMSNLTGTNAAAGTSGGILYAGGANGNYTINGTTGRLTPENGNGQALLFNVYSGTLNVNALAGNGGSNIVKSGEGTLVLGADNSGNMTGAHRVYQGVLRLANANATGTNAGGITVQNGAALELSGGLSFVDDALTITGTGISDGGALRNFSGANTYQGAITIGSGGARINNADTGNTLNVRGITTGAYADVTFGGAGNITHSTTAISGAGGVIKDGNGTLTLSATNTYTGATLVSAGKLAVNGSLANTSSVTVGNTATLQGSGLIVSSVTIQNGGTLATGNSIESLGTGALALNAGSTFAYELQTDLYVTTPNVAGDLTFVTGNLDITAGALLTLSDLATSTVLAANSSLTLISYTGIWNGGLFTYNATTLNDDSTFVLGSNTWRFNYNDTLEGANYTTESNGLFVTMTVVPEPRAALLGCLGVLLLLRRRR